MKRCGSYTEGMPPQGNASLWTNHNNGGEFIQELGISQDLFFTAFSELFTFHIRFEKTITILDKVENLHFARALFVGFRCHSTQPMIHRAIRGMKDSNLNEYRSAGAGMVKVKQVSRIALQGGWDFGIGSGHCQSRETERALGWLQLLLPVRRALSGVM